MRFGRVALRISIGVLFAVACSEPTAVGGDLVATWAGAPEDLSPAGWYQIKLTFGATGAFRAEVRNYGLYPAQHRSELSAYERTEGTYRTEGDRLILMPQRLVTWDRFYGASSAERVDEPYPYTGYLNGARYRIEGSLLMIEYTSYPADAPVATTMILGRER